MEKLDHCLSCNREFTEETNKYDRIPGKVKLRCKNLCTQCYSEDYKKRRRSGKVRDRFKPLEIETNIKVVRRENKERLRTFVDDVNRRAGWVNEIDLFKIADLFAIYFENPHKNIDSMAMKYQFEFMWNFLKTLC